MRGAADPMNTGTSAIQQARVGFVGESILAGPGVVTGIEIRVGELQVSGSCFLQKFGVILDGFIDAGDVEIFGFLRRNFESESLERANLGHEAEDKREDASLKPWLAIAFTPLFLILGAG